MNPRSSISLLAAALLAISACDTRLVGTDDNALINLTPGPHQGQVGDQVPVEATPGEPGQQAPTLSAATERLAFVRAELGLAPLAPSANLEDAAHAHASYLAAHRDWHEANGVSAHAEVADLPGFTGQNPSARASHAGYPGLVLGEVIGYHPTPAGTLEAWLESLYHRLPLLRPDATELGFAAATSDRVNAHVMLVGADPGAADLHGDVVVYPPNGAVDVPSAWSGLEIPEPPAPPAGYPSGPVLTLSAPAGRLVPVRVDLRPAGGGPTLAVSVLSYPSDPNLSPRDVAVIPHSPLEASVTYELWAQLTLDGQDITLRSSFTTRPAGCTLGADDCGPGRACYAADGALRCLWEGAGALDATCRHLDDCAGGLTCLGSRCRPLCEAESAPCDDVCPGDALLPTGVDGVNACVGGACTANSCGAGQGCFWLSGLACGWAGDLQPGATCDFANDCRAGLTCLGTNQQPQTCHTLCDGPAMPRCDAVCATTPLTLDPVAGVRACL